MQGRSRRLLGLLAAFAALGIVAWFWRYDLREAAAALRNVGWPALLVLPLYLGWTLAAARGWRLLFVGVPTAEVPSTGRLFAVRLATQIVGLGVPVGTVAAGAVRAVLTTGPQRIAVGLSAVTLDSLVDAVAGLAFFLVGSLVVLDGSGTHAGWIVSGVVVAAGLAALAWHAHRLAGLAARRLRGRGGRWLDALSRLSEAGPGLRGTMVRSGGWRLLERLLMCGEIAVASWALGVHLAPWEAVFAAAWMMGVGMLFFYVPGEAGANEAGLLIAFGALGLPASTALAIALLRRARQVIAAALGAPLLAVLSSTGSHRGARIPAERVGGRPCG